MEERVIVLCPESEIDGNVVREFLEQFTTLDLEEGPIRVIICSDGGWMQGGCAIYDAIRTARNHVTTVGLGTVGSIAVLILQAGDNRILTQNTGVFLHEASIHNHDGNVTATKVIADELSRLHDKYCALLAERSGKDVKVFRDLCRVETNLDASEALALGLADQILGSVTISTSKKKRKNK